jgi:hypothetical protein
LFGRRKVAGTQSLAKYLPFNFINKFKPKSVRRLPNAICQKSLSSCLREKVGQDVGEILPSVPAIVTH